MRYLSFFFLFEGSLELRADGSFHEWTLENQSPGGSAKLGPGALDKAVIGVRVSSSMGIKAALLRTHPPLGYPGVEALSYSGSFPVTRLSVRDKRFFGVEMDLFAYGTLRPRKTNLSFVPGMAFTLSVKNPTQKAVNVSFLLNIPLGEQPGNVNHYGHFLPKTKITLLIIIFSGLLVISYLDSTFISMLTV